MGDSIRRTIVAERCWESMVAQMKEERFKGLSGVNADRP